MTLLPQLYISIFFTSSTLAFLLSSPISLQQSVATKSHYNLLVLSAKKKVKKKNKAVGSSSGKGFGSGGQKKSLSSAAKDDAHQQANNNDMSTTSTIHTNLLSWLKQHPTTYISSNFIIQPSTLGGYGGFVTTNSFQKDELILRIPRNECCVTYNDALNDSTCGESFRKLIYDNRIPSWGMILISGWIAKEYMIDCESDNVMESSIQEEDSSGSNNSNNNRRKHTPYLQSLPWYQGGKLQQEHILFWADDEIETLLKGSKAYDDAMLIRKTVDNAIELLRDVIVPIVDQVRVDIHGDTLDDTPVNNKVNYKEVMKGAFVIALSRSFAEEVELDDGTIEIENVLLPLIDILQHSNAPNTYLESYDDYIQVHAAREIDVGEELFHQYQAEDDDVIPPYKFFTRYGFIPGNKEPVRDLLKSKSSLFFD